MSSKSRSLRQSQALAPQKVAIETPRLGRREGLPNAWEFASALAWVGKICRKIVDQLRRLSALPETPLLLEVEGWD